MPEIPNTNTPGQRLLSQGDGYNTSYWGPNNQGWSTYAVLSSGNVAQTANYYLTLSGNLYLLNINVGGFTNYLVNYSFAQANTNASGTAAMIAQIVDANGAQLQATQVGIFTASTRNAWSGSAVVSSANYGNQPFTLSLCCYTGSGSCTIGYANLSVVGLN